MPPMTDLVGAWRKELEGIERICSMVRLNFVNDLHGGPCILVKSQDKECKSNLNFDGNAERSCA